TMSDSRVQKKIADVAAPVERSYDSLRRQLKDQHAVGVVVAVGDRIIWADLFASPELLEKYWPKLVRSYAAESLGATHGKAQPSFADAQGFLARLEGSHQSIDSEPGVYRSVETVGGDFHVFELSSLMPKAAFEVHLSKIADSDASAQL